MTGYRCRPDCRVSIRGRAIFGQLEHTLPESGRCGAAGWRHVRLHGPGPSPNGGAQRLRLRAVVTINTSRNREQHRSSPISASTRTSKEAYFGGGVGVWDLNSQRHASTEAIFVHGGFDISTRSLQWNSRRQGLHVGYAQQDREQLRRTSPASATSSRIDSVGCNRRGRVQRALPFLVSAGAPSAVSHQLADSYIFTFQVEGILLLPRAWVDTLEKKTTWLS